MKIGQFWKISTKALPRCSAAAGSTAVIPFLSVSIARATNVASAPIASSEIALKGQSIQAIGVDFVHHPQHRSSAEYCPLVAP